LFGCSGIRVRFGLCLAWHQRPRTTWLAWQLVRAWWEALAVESASKRALNCASIGNSARSRLGGHAFLVALAFKSASACTWYCTGGRAPLELALPTHVYIGARSGLSGHASLVALALESASVCAWHGISRATVLVFARLLAQDWVAILVWFLWHLHLHRIVLSNGISGRVPLGLRLQFVHTLSVESSSSQASNRALIAHGARSSPLPIKLRIALRLATVLSHDWVATLLLLLRHLSLLRFELGMASEVAYHLVWHCSFVRSSGSQVRFETSFELRFDWQQCSLTTGWPHFFGRSEVRVCVGLCLCLCLCLCLVLHWWSRTTWVGLCLHRRSLRTRWPRFFGGSGIGVCFALCLAWHQQCNGACLCKVACSRMGGHTCVVSLAFASASNCAFRWHQWSRTTWLRLQFARALSVESSSSQASNRALIGNGARSSPLPIKFRIALRLATVLAHDWVATLLLSLRHLSLRRLVLGTALAVAHHLGWLMFASALAPDSVATLLWWLWHWSPLRFVLGMASAVQRCLSLQGCLLKTGWPYLFGFSGICVCIELRFPMASVVAYHLGLGCSLSARCQSSPLRVKLRIAL
jgi:hypothetical protein